MNAITPISVEDVLDQVMWYNSNIKRANKMWIEPGAWRLGLKKIKYTYDLTTKRFISYDNLIRKFPDIQDSIDFIKYNAIVISVPKLWETILSQNVTGEKTDRGLECFPRGYKFTKFIYWEMLRKEKFKKNDKDPLITLWEHELKKEIETSEWERISESWYWLTNSTKLRYFQYRCIMRKLKTIIHVSKLNLNVLFAMARKRPHIIYFGNV